MAALYRFRLALLVLVLVFLGGAAGYMLIERWSAFDAIYMTGITLATVGYTEVRPLSAAGRVFTLALILSGRIAETYALVVFTQVVVVEPLHDILGRRRMERALENLADHYIICGWGRMGQEIVEQFRSQRVPVVVIDTDVDKCRRLTEQGILNLHGDASNDAVLQAAGVARAQGLIAVAPRDADNIFITLSARALNSRLFIVTRSSHEQDVHKLEIAGADRVISPYVIGARRIAAAVFHPGVAEFLDQRGDSSDLGWRLQEVIVPAEATFAGKPLRDGGLRQQSGCTVLAIRTAGTAGFVSNPPSEQLLSPGDTLVVLGTPEQLDRLAKLMGPPTPQKSGGRRPA